jgi:membrane protease YdiL (CAAX protease family)
MINVFSDFGFKRLSLRTFWFAVLLGLLAYFFNVFVSTIFSSVLAMLGYRFPTSDYVFSGGWGLMLSLFLIGVLPGICEETAHRGMLLNGFRQKVGIVRAVLLSSILFGLMHMSIYQVFYTTILGFVMGVAVVATRNIWVGVIMHFMNNAINTYLSFPIKGGLPFQDFWSFVFSLPTYMGFDETSANLFVIVIIFAGIWFVGKALLSLLCKLSKENFERHRDAATANFIANYPIDARVLNERFLAIKGLPLLRDLEINFDITREMLGEFINTKGKIEATKLYLNCFERTEKLSPKEFAMLSCLIFFGGLVTIFTLVFGLL